LGELPAGYDHKYTYSTVGYNLKATDIQAALGLSQLRKLPQFVEARRRNWRRLYDGIAASPSLREALIPIEATPDTDPSWFGFPVHCHPGISREKLVAFLEERRIGTRLMFAGNLTKQPAYRGLTYRICGELRATDEIMARTFWLGVHPALDEQRISYMLEQLECAILRAAR
jgi:CDP-6-deoxy-D-xylo-4-hexulose-3-dehydrase